MLPSKYLENKKLTGFIVAGIIFIAFVLRVYGINSGLPHLPLHIDEPQMIENAMEIGEGLNPRTLGWPGTSYMFILSFLYAVYFIISNIGNLLSNLIQRDPVGLTGIAENFYIFFYRDPSNWYIISRFVTVLFGTATIYVTYLCSRKLYGTTVGIVASFLLTFTQLHTAFSHHALSDVPMTFFVMLAFLYCYYLYKYRKTKHFIMAGLFSGLAIATKFNAGIMILTIFVAHLLSQRQAPFKWKNVLPDRKLLLTYGFLVLGFYIGCPYIVVQLAIVLKEVMLGTIGPRVGGDSLIRGMRFVAANLRVGMGSTLLLLSAAGILYSLWRHTREDILTLSFPIIYLLNLINSTAFYPRYFMPVLPFLAILGARVLVDAIDKIPLRETFRPIAGLLAVFLIMIIPFVKVIGYERKLSRQDTRLLAKQWIEANVPSGSEVALHNNVVPLAKSKATLQKELSIFSDTETAIQKKYKSMRGPEAEYPYVVFSNLFLNDEQIFIKQRKYALKDPEYPRINYDIVNFSEHPVSLFLVAYDDIMEEIRNGSSLDILASDSEIEELGEPVKVFAPSHAFKGPTIRIYQLNPELKLS